MKRTRQWHLWIGLISSFFIFIQAATGLIMSEPWIIGQSENERGMMPNDQNLPSGSQPSNGTNNNSNTENAATTELANSNSSTNNSTNDSSTNNNGQNSQNQNGNFQPPSEFGGQNGQGGDIEGEQSGIMGIIKGMHQGQIGSVNLHVYIDILAICLMVLTATGIVLSIKVLKAQAKRNKKQKLASGLE